MTEQRPPRVFISYSHDSELHAARVLRLANDLRRDGVDAVIDQYITSPPEGWPRWMDSHVRDDDFVVMVCTETYYRRVIGKEAPGTGLGVCWEGNLIYNHLYETDLTRFVPVLMDGGKRADIPEALRSASYYFIDQSGGYEGLLRRLFNRPAAEMPPVGERPALPVLAPQWTERPLGRLHNVPDLPPNFVARPDDIELVKALLMGDAGGTVGITSSARKAGLLGMGGIGKTVLATALVRDEQVRERFADGVFWLSFGREAVVTLRQTELARMLGDSAASFENWQQGRGRLSELTADRAALVVLDDVWQPGHAEGFTRLGPGMGLVVTTRDQAVLDKAGARAHRLDLLSKDAARALLRESAGLAADAPMPPATDTIAGECGLLPLAISVVGALIRSGRFDWQRVLARLKAADIKRLRAKLPEYEAESVLAALQVSVEELPEREQRAFPTCAVLPEDVAVPEAALLTLWSEIYDDEEDARDAAQLFVERSLMSRDEARRYRLHDLYHDYLRAECADLAAAHGRFVEAYRQQCPNGWASGPDDGYFFRHMPYHLEQAGRGDELRDLLLDYHWIWAKLAATDVPALLADYAQTADADAALVGRALMLSAHVIGRDPHQLPAQVVGRLRDIGRAPIDALVGGAREEQAFCWFCPRTRSLAPPGVLLRTFTGHEDSVTAVALLADGRRALSGSRDRSLRLWDLERGAELRRFDGHDGEVNAVALLADGRRALSGSWDKTLRLWDLGTGAELRRFEGHESLVTAVALLPDGRRALSGSWDKTLRLWDLETGADLRRFEGHEREVISVALLADGRGALSGSWDQTLRLWDLETGTELRRFEGHEHYVTAVAPLPEGRRALSGSADGTLRLWDLETGAEMRRFEGHEHWVTAVALLADGRRALSGSRDRSLRLWDLETGAELRRFDGHDGEVNAVALLADGRRALSGSWDKTLRLWDLETGADLRRFEGHEREVISVALLADGRRALSGSEDKTLRLWDLKTGAEMRRFEGHEDRVSSVALLADGRRALSGSRDGTLRLWDLETGAELRRFDGHAWINSVALLADGRRALLGFCDRTLRLWDLETGAELRRFEDHAWISSVALLADGRRALSAGDGTLRLWDLETGAELRRFEGHAWISSVAVLPDGRRALCGFSDGTLRLWDMETGAELRRFEAHEDRVTAVALLADGRRALSGSHDQTLRLWDLETGACLAVFTADAAITAVAVARDNLFVAGSANGAIHILELRGPKVMA